MIISGRKNLSYCNKDKIININIVTTKRYIFIIIFYLMTFTFCLVIFFNKFNGYTKN